MNADLTVRVASTPEEQARGLMFVSNLPSDEGMLFVFGRSQKLSFWGENTFVALDIAFADEDGVIKNIEYIHPMSRSPVRSSGDCKYAIEANAGYFKNHGIEPGDEIVFKDKSDRNCKIGFRSGKLAKTIRNLSRSAQLMSDEEIERQREKELDMDVSNDLSPPSSLPVVSPGDIQSYLADADFEEQPDQIVEQPSEMPDAEVPELELPEEISDEAHPHFDNVYDAVDEYAKPEFSNNFVGKTMRIQYTTKSGHSISRDVEPHGTFHADSTGNEILVTYDRTVGDIRAFIMQNIQAFAFLSDKFEPKFILEQ